MIEGVISWAPSQSTPPKGWAKVWPEIAAVYVPAASSSKAKVPSSALVVVATCLPEESRSSSVTPGSPSSPFSTFPALPPPGLKSLQTTPVMPSGFAGGLTACFAPSGTSSGGSPTVP